jgi:predicted O-methyltransferase YrrM
MNLISEFLRLFRTFRRLERENLRLRQFYDNWHYFVPPGHFYSPLPDRGEISEGFARNNFGPPFAGIDLNEDAQFDRLQRFAEWYAEHPFHEQPTFGYRYCFQNAAYGASDAIMLYSMMRELRPNQIIEVGSGYSSAAMLDVAQYTLKKPIAFTFIDPHVKLLDSLLLTQDRKHVKILERKVQDVPLEVFTKLEKNDILFIDSSHVSKFGSDVNHLFFNVLPILSPGVFIHFHDIAWRLEYPREWLDEGRAWNEQYLLRSFLMYNKMFRVELFTSYLEHFKREFITRSLPLCSGGGGGQLWLSKQNA